MKLKEITSPSFCYTYIFMALTTLISFPLQANTFQYSVQNETNKLKDADLKKAKIFRETAITSNSKAFTPPVGVRMGEWLAKEYDQAQHQYYQSALVWLSSVEAESQQRKFERFRQNISDFVASSNSSAKLEIFNNWINALPVTGRIILPNQDPRYLQVNPNVEPVFQQGDVVILHQRPDTVTVVFDDTQACRVVYQAGVKSKSYIDQCQLHLDKNVKADDAYLISAEGIVQHITLANWNAQQQVTPNAGAWLWVPSAKHHWPKQLAAEVAQFLATQGIDLPLANGQDETPIKLSKATPENSRDLPISSSDWGVIGLLQTPTARMHRQGTLATHISDANPYTQYNLVLQPYNWLETTVRYSNIDGVSYGAVSPDQDLKDKSLDIKLKLLDEDRWLPELAVGWRDIAGTSLFAGEYLVANKRYGDFDFSLGMGWGYLGARGNVDNPLGAINDRFEDRVGYTKGEGGDLSPKTWFTGPTSLFGGIQWHTPYDPLTLKIEYDGNDYQSEPYSNKNYNTKGMPVNIGVTWQNVERGVALSAGYERGDTLMGALTLQGDLTELGKTKPKAYQVKNIESLPETQYSSLKYQINLNSKDEKSKNATLLNAFSQATGWKATSLIINNSNVLLTVDDYGGVFIKERLQQGMEILRQALPSDTNFIQIQFLRYGEPVGVFNIDPQTWYQQHLQLLPPSQRNEAPITVTSAAPNYLTPTTQVVAHYQPPKASLTLSPSLQQSIGGPDGYLYGIFASATADYKLWQGAWVDAKAQARLVDNYDNYDYTADSKLPRVRTNIKEYMTTSRILMPNLQLNQFKSFGDNLYGLAYAGYLDPMFAGVGAEVLYRPPNQSWAVGVDLNRVKQRDFDQHFGLRDYEVSTGHATLYWDTPWYDVDMKLSAGQYLAGDKGATVDLSRQFNNGVKMGGWITKTDVTSEEFGEGSLDKGIYVSIPLDAIFKQWSSGSTALVYQPLIRDGGAKLNRRNELINLTSPLDKSALEIKNPSAH